MTKQLLGQCFCKLSFTYAGWPTEKEARKGTTWVVHVAFDPREYIRNRLTSRSLTYHLLAQSLDSVGERLLAVKRVVWGAGVMSVLCGFGWFGMDGVALLSGLGCAEVALFLRSENENAVFPSQSLRNCAVKLHPGHVLR